MSNEMSVEYKAYEKWSRSYFGHGMPPSQSYYESTMSAFIAGYNERETEIKELRDAVMELHSLMRNYKYLVFSEAARKVVVRTYAPLIEKIKKDMK